MSVTEDRQGANTVLAGSGRGKITAVFSDISSNIVKLMCCNILFVIFNIPAMGIAYLIVAFILPKFSTGLASEEFVSTLVGMGLHGETNRSNDITGTDAAVSLYILLIVFCIMLLVTSLLVCVGPVQAGFAKVYAALSGGSGSSIKEFKAGFAQNLKQSIPAMLISVAVTFICLLSVSFYLSLGLVPLAALFAVILAFLPLIQSIVYRTMVTEDLKLWQMYKNAVLMMLIKFLPSLGMAVLNAVVFAVVPFVLLMSSQLVMIGIYVFLYMFILTAVMHYLNSIYAESLIRRFVSTDKEEHDD